MRDAVWFVLGLLALAVAVAVVGSWAGIAFVDAVLS